MESLKKDTRGQWIALSGLVLSLILIGLAALANQALIAGYHSSNAVLEFPKENIRELNSHTRDNAEILKSLSFEINNSTNNTVPVIFEQLFDNYSTQMETLYAAHGETVDISLVSINSNNGTYNNNSDIDVIFVNLTYNDGSTHYVSEPEVIRVTK
ncbi:hypothetical protein [Methanolobus sp.]|jgi:hypothetical protein|uniref:hypothetical protein n=1 Tax=Methanolobus sp. TaxID=1874737 RepID=UPI0025FF8A69|nr:hypothetical protein [Methanolobus sp.]